MVWQLKLAKCAALTSVWQMQYAMHKIKPLYLFEASMRAWLVTGPRWVSQLLPSIHRVIGLGFMYMMLQVLALLWAFLLNAASSVALDISGLAARHALDFTLDVSLVRAFATFYVVYGTFRVFARFGGAVGLIAWESLDDFPHACRVATDAAETWPYFISVAFLPQFCLATLLLITPTLCDGYGKAAGGQSANKPFTFVQDTGTEMRQFICTRTPLLYLGEGYPKARHTLKLVLVVGLLQYFQVLLHRYPNWRAELAGISSSTSSTDLATTAATAAAAAGDTTNTAGTDTTGIMPSVTGSDADTTAAHSTTANSSSNGGSGQVHVHVTINHDSSNSSATATDTTIAGTRSGATAGVADDVTQHGQRLQQQPQCVRRRGARRSVRMALHFALMGCLAFT
eukprot:9171-Heterococcus_DN1.PRE.5